MKKNISFEEAMLLLEESVKRLEDVSLSLDDALGEYEKAVLYFGIASRQRPGNSQYRSAYHNAEAIRNQRRGEDFIGRLMRPFAGKKG